MSMLDFVMLYSEHASDVHRFALFLCADPALAEDIASETFVRAWGARERVDLATVKGYLFTIARHLYLHELRRARPRREEALAAEQLAHLATEEASPERAALARDELATVLAALQRMSEIDRAAILMRAESQLPYEEIAAALGITVAAAKVKVHRARLRLAEARVESKAAREMENRR